MLQGIYLETIKRNGSSLLWCGRTARPNRPVVAMVMPIDGFATASP